MSPTFMTWIAMRQRCSYRAGEKYKTYGARGIKVCRRWDGSFESFLADMGVRPKGKTLDRYPNRKGDYRPGNCRWATPKQQAANSDNFAKGWKRRNTKCPSGHSYADAYVRKDGSRTCRTCQIENKRARYAAAKAAR